VGDRHRGIISLSPPSVAGWIEYPAKARRVNRHIAWYTSPYPRSHSVVLVPGCTDWLAVISADLREAIAAIWGVFATLRYTNLPLLY